RLLAEERIGASLDIEGEQVTRVFGVGTHLRRALLSEGFSLCLRGKAWNICPAAMSRNWRPGTMSPYKVMVDDNFHYMAEDERWEYGTFTTAEEALDACRRLVDEALMEEYRDGATAEQLFVRYTSFGDDPFIVALDDAEKVDFSASAYAEQRAAELTTPGPVSAERRRAVLDGKRRPHRRRRLSARAFREKSSFVVRDREQAMTTPELPAREAMEFDTVIVGAGPAGLAAAIRLKQLAPERTVVVVEKGSEVGAHILSGAVIDPIGLDRLIPEWRDEDTPIKTAVTADHFYALGPSGALRLPNFLLPPLMSNHGNFIVSLGDVCRFLAKKAEALGVEIYPGFAAAEVLFENGAVAGVATGDMGVGKDGHHKSSFTRGMELRGKYTLFAEGARGSLTKTLIERFALAQDRQPQKFGIGLKELWQVVPEKHRRGLVRHTMGWPLGNRTGGGSFLYHFDDNLVSVGFVVHLNYQNPY